ncbi:hypothetical protein [Geodermatophilus sp. SYSU D01176]
MTTATTTGTAPPTAPAPTTVAQVLAAEVTRLEGAIEAAEDRIEGLEEDVRARQDALNSATAELAALQQEASTLHQQLTAATSRPARHRVELLLEANAVAQGRALHRKLTATDDLARAQAQTARETALLARMRGDLARVQDEARRAGVDAGTTAATVADLPDAVAELRAAAADLADEETTAGERLATLLGGRRMLERTRARVSATLAADAARTAALAEALQRHRAAQTARSPVDGAVAATREALDQARRAVQDAVETAPGDLERARTVLTLLIDFPDLAEQADIDALAAAVGDEGGEPLEKWAAALPAAVTELAVALPEAGATLARLRGLDAAQLRQRLESAETAHAQALTAQLAAQRAVDDAAAAVEAARTETTVHQATAAQRRPLLLRLDGLT